MVGVEEVCPDPGSNVSIAGLSPAARACDGGGGVDVWRAEVCSLVGRRGPAQTTFWGLLKMRELNHRAMGSCCRGFRGWGGRGEPWPGQWAVPRLCVLCKLPLKT